MERSRQQLLASKRDYEQLLTQLRLLRERESLLRAHFTVLKAQSRKSALGSETPKGSHESSDYSISKVHVDEEMEGTRRIDEGKQDERKGLEVSPQCNARESPSGLESCLTIVKKSESGHNADTVEIDKEGIENDTCRPIQSSVSMFVSSVW